jgi:MoaA/NifB/PqqE/SkfB family radical SAM enzyme
MAKSPWDVARRVPAFAPIVARKPGIVAQVLRNQYLERVRKKKVIKAIEVGVTYDCQATCDKCSAIQLQPAKGSKRDRLDRRGFAKIAKGADELACYEVNFTGGEPLLAPDLDEIISLFHPKRTFMGLNTNGELLSERRVQELKARGIDLFKISLDSPVADEHDESRGRPGLFEHIVEMLDVIRGTFGVRAHLCTVATRDNVRAGKVQGVLDLALKHDATVGVVFPSPVGGWTGQSVAIGPEEHEMLRPIAEHPAVFYHGNLGSDGFRCPCGKDEIYITCYGDIMPCPFVQVSFGTIAKEGFAASYQRMTNHPEIARERTLCMGSEDARFRELYLDPIEKMPTLPCHIDDHPSSDIVR